MGRRTQADRVLSSLVAVFAVVAVLLAWLTWSRTSDDAAPAIGSDQLDEAARERIAAGPLRVGWFRGAEPVSVWDGDELVGGYAVEQWRLMALKLGFEVEHVVLDDIPAVVAALREGAIDVAGTQGQRPDLLEFAGTTEPLAWERITFVGTAEEVGRGVGTLAGRTVTTVAGSPLEQVLLAQFPAATYVPTATIPDGLAAVDRGEIDLYLAPLAVVGWANRQGGVDLLPIGESLQLIPVSAWAVEGSPALEIARAARSQLTQEEISLLTARWAGFDLGPPVRETTPGWLLATLWGTLAVLAAATVFAWVLRRRVAAATAELRELNATLESRVVEATRQLRDSNGALRRFAESVAHDLKSPLSAIIGFGDLLGRVELDPKMRVGLAERVRRLARSMVAVVDGMLADAVRVGVTDGTEELAGEEFAAWVREVSEPEIDLIGGRLELEVPDGLVMAGPLDVLRRTVMNLVANAAKYAVNDEGTLVRVSLERLGEDVQLRVDDNGPGIPQELRATVFESGKRLVLDDRGFGLGLAAVRDLIQGAGGAIRIQDSPLGGAAFIVLLPMPVADRDDAAQVATIDLADA